MKAYLLIWKILLFLANYFQFRYSTVWNPHLISSKFLSQVLGVVILSSILILIPFHTRYYTTQKASFSDCPQEPLQADWILSPPAI